jgi:sulfur dioxygenase
MKQSTFNIQAFHADRGCLSYLLTDRETGEAALIDPSMEIVDRYRAYLEEYPETKLVWLLETHTYADHVSASKTLRGETGARIAMSALSPSPSKGRALKDGDEVVFGGSKLTVWGTAGHTNESLTYVADGVIFTGDTLLIGGTGRTDFQLGESEALYASLARILTLPEETVVYPGHDYKRRQSSTLREEKETNGRLQMVAAGKHDEFVAAMDAHHPALPELFKESLRENSL